MRKMLEQQKLVNEELKKRNQKMKDHLLQQQTNQLVAKKGRKVRKSEMDKEEKRWLAIIYEAVKGYVWNIAKFCNNEEKLDNITKAVMIGVDPEEFDGVKGRDLVRAERRWVANNREYVRNQFNECRNYAAGRLRDAVIKLGVNHPNGFDGIPKPEDILDCITREPELFTGQSGEPNLEGQALFDQFVDGLESALG